MIWRSPEPRYDVASGLSQGARDYQEDAIITDFPYGMDSGVAVLADGMGGHEAGDVASKIVLTEVYSELKFRSATFADQEQHIPDCFAAATAGANATISDFVKANPEARGMGATLLSLVLVENRLFWMSVGDSPLYLLRAGKLSQLNEDHSMAPQIDFMVQQNLLSAEKAANHPDRNCLTSVIIGQSIAKSDCPMTPFELQMGDVVLVSSDGLQYLGEPRLQKILHKYRRRKSAEIAGHLLEAVAELNDPDQDNVSFSVIKLNHMKPVERKIIPKPIGSMEDHTASLTRVVGMDGQPLAAPDETPPPKPQVPPEVLPKAEVAAKVHPKPDSDTTQTETPAEAETDVVYDTVRASGSV
ncbi:MAG: PP2C family serine/threonine-protein phosphatase [Sedimentitalea sp.]